MPASLRVHVCECVCVLSVCVNLCVALSLGASSQLPFTASHVHWIYCQFYLLSLLLLLLAGWLASPLFAVIYTDTI